MWQPFGKLFQIPLVVRAVIIDTFVNTEVFTVFDRLECMPAVRAPEFERGNNVFSGNKGLPADLAFELPTAAGIVIDVFMRGRCREDIRYLSVRYASCLSEFSQAGGLSHSGDGNTRSRVSSPV